MGSIGGLETASTGELFEMASTGTSVRASAGAAETASTGPHADGLDRLFDRGRSLYDGGTRAIFATPASSSAALFKTRMS